MILWDLQQMELLLHWGWLRHLVQQQAWQLWKGNQVILSHGLREFHKLCVNANGAENYSKLQIVNC
jgi:hypothetical protein